VRSFVFAFILSAASLLASDVTGKWRGSLEFTNDNGETRKGSAFMDLKQDGVPVSGTAGPNESESHQLRDGKFENNKLTFRVAADDAYMKVDLTLDGDELKGQVTREDGGGRVIKLALKRAQ
jgi:hypothetical protein